MFNAISTWIPSDSVAGGLAILALAVTLGLLLGAIPIHRIKLGISGVLFSALLFGQIGLSVDAKVLQFLRDFALILFMYSIGLQVGPAFISSLRTEGLRLNILAVAVLVLGALMAEAVGGHLGHAAAPGLFTGAFTTTPGFAAAQENLHRAGSSHEVKEAEAQIRLAYTITYPFGIIGPALVVVILRRVFRIRIEDERTALTSEEDKRRSPIDKIDFELTNPVYIGKKLRDIPMVRDYGIIFSRMLRAGAMSVPTDETELQLGDTYRAVGPRERLTELVTTTGRLSEHNLDAMPGDIRRMNLVVTRTKILRRPLRDLDIIRRTGVTIVRVNRAGVDLTPNAALRLVFGDHVTVVGPDAGLKMVEAELGNCLETLNRPQLVPIFVGIVLGVVIGSIPLAIPGINTTLRIGLAGGPLLAAIALSQLGNIGSVVWYMPVSASQLFRDFGLAVFLACVGLQAGDHFIQRAAQGPGLSLLLCGALITTVPVFIVASFARLVLRMNFITLSGWVAGAMTSSPALLFADEMAQSDAPAVAYAAVAPLATLVPIICAQVLAIAVR